jgi:hypothetical protein
MNFHLQQCKTAAAKISSASSCSASSNVLLRDSSAASTRNKDLFLATPQSALKSRAIALLAAGSVRVIEYQVNRLQSCMGHPQFIVGLEAAPPVL